MWRGRYYLNASAEILFTAQFAYVTQDHKNSHKGQFSEIEIYTTFIHLKAE